MLPPYAITYITIAIYTGASLAGLCGMLLRKPLWRKLGCWLALLAFFCQTLALILGFHHSLTGALSIGAYLQLLAWFFLLCGIGAWWRLREETLILLAAPFGLVLFLISAQFLEINVSLPAYLSSAFYALHIGALFLSLGLLFVAFIAGILFMVLEKRLKGKKNIKGFWRDMPSLLLLDNINSACALGSFPLYTLGILTGLIWSAPVYGQTISGDPKEIASLFIWILLAVLFHNRLALGWKGRKPALLAVIIFILSLFSIFAVNFLFPSHHSFLRN